MPPRSRYAVDPSLTAQAQQPAPVTGEWVYPGQPNHPVQSTHHQPGQNSQFIPPEQFKKPPHQYSDPYVYQQSQGQTFQLPSGPYVPSSIPNQEPQHHNRPIGPQPIHPSFVPPSNHIQPPPHSSGPAIAGPRVRIDPAQVPNPVEAQELDQNLYDDEDFLSCDTKGLIPLAGTDYRGVDQGNSLPRHVRVTLPVIPSNSQLLETTALPFAAIIQPLARSRLDEEPVPLVSSWVAGESTQLAEEVEDEGPPRCEKCRGYINPWVRFIDGGRKWICNLCGNSNIVAPSYFSHLTPTGHRADHQSRPELMYGTIDILVPRSYWFPQPPPTGSLVDSALDSSTSNLQSAGDALASTGADLLGALQSSLGQTPSNTRGPSPVPGYKEREKERKKEEMRLRRPRPISRVFVVDVSGPSVQRGIVREVCEGLKKAFFGSMKVGEEGEVRRARAREVEDLTDDEVAAEVEVIGTGERVAIVTVGETVGFWNLSPTLASPSLMVVSDLDDMFIPFTTGFLVDPLESRKQIETLLDMLPGMYEAYPDGNRIAAGAAIQGVLPGLRMLGGQIILFLSGLPTIGPGKLQPREDPTIYNTDKEKTLFSPSDPFWQKTAEELAECGVGVNTFLFPEQYTDVASLGALSAITGGTTFFHPRFSPVRDRETLHSEILRTVSLIQMTGYNATVRIRCSNGLRVSDHLGNFYQRNSTDLEFGCLDEDKAFVAVLKHESSGRLDDRQQAFIQVATLYTVSSGERVVRLMNLALGVSSMIGNVFRFADLDAAVTVFVKGAVSQMPQKNLRDIRKTLTDRCNRVLLMYRRHCAPAVQPGQLILPEGFKLLPLYTLCMLKTKALKGGNVTSDVRSHYMRQLKSLSTTATLNLLYPRLLAIHNLTKDIGFNGDNGRFKLPRFMRASYAYMVAEGAYLMSNGEVAMLWLGAAVSPQILNDLYGVENLDELDTRMTQLPKIPTLLSNQIRNILTCLERSINHPLPLIIVRQNMDGMEIEFANQLVEDSNNDALSYTDYLMTAHKSITNELSGNPGKGEGWKVPWS